MSSQGDIPRRGLLHTGRTARFRSAPKSDRLGTGIGDRVAPESVIGLDRNTQEAEAAAARAVERARQAGEGTRAEGVAACFRAVRALLQASGA